MSTINGWNISKLTGHADPVLGGIAYDADRQRLWLSEQDYGLVRLDFRTGDYEMFRYRMEEPDRYGPVAISCDGSVFVGVNNSDKILRFDQDLNPLPHITFKSVLGLNSCEDAVVALVDMGNSLGIACYNETGNRLWTTQVASGPSSHFFICNNSVICTEEYIIVLVAQRNIECVFVGYDGRILNRKPINIPPGSWSEELAEQCTGNTPCGRRYLMDAGYNARLNSLLMLYAPASGNHGLVLIGWPFSEDAEPYVYEIPFWTSRMLVYGARVIFFGSDTYSGPKKVFPVGLRELELIPHDELPFLTMATASPDTNLLQQLFSEAPAIQANEEGYIKSDNEGEQPDISYDINSDISQIDIQSSIERSINSFDLNNHEDKADQEASSPPVNTFDLSSQTMEAYDPFTNLNSDVRFSLNGEILDETPADKHTLSS